MASVSGTSNSLNSLYNTYGNANTVTGLASGMDTETMIEQAVSGFQKKIESLQKRQTLLQWKQTQMRSYITMLNNLTSNYASYRSKTNLYSPSFFTGTMTSSAVGVNANKVSVTGGSNSSIAINSVAKLATAATYQVDASAIFGGANGTGEKIAWGNPENPEEILDLSTFADQSITVTLDGVTKSIRIGDLAKDVSEITNTTDLAAALQTKLDGAFGKGRVTVADNDGALKFGATGSSTVKAVSDASALGLGNGVMNYLDVNNTKVVDVLCKDHGYGVYSYNGKYYTEVDGELVDSKGNALALEINGAKIKISAGTTVAGLVSNINLSDAGVTASYSQLTNKLTFTSKETGAGSKIEFGGVLGSAFQPSAAPKNVSAASLFGDIQWDENGEATVYINNTDSFTLKKTDTVKDLIEKVDEFDHYKDMIKYDPDSGTYGLYDMDGTGISFSIPESDIELDLTDMIGKLNGLGPVYTAGQDAELTVTVNGEQMTLRRSSNTVELDGLSVTLKGTFNVDEDGNMIDGESVTFESQVDTEDVVSAVKSFVDDYNALMKAIREAYTTQPTEKNSSTHTKYEPLTDSEKEGLSDKTIEQYEEKAKTGMFFMDSDLSSLYSKLTGILSTNRGALAEIGISVEYDSNSRTNYLVVDEDKLSAALENDPNKVATVFAGKNGEGGVMSEVQSVVKNYASTSTGNYGILVRKSGATESAISQLANNNAYQKQIESLEDEIDKWKDKLSTKIDYYSRQFSMLEQLMGSYNSQSSMLMSMMGGY